MMYMDGNEQYRAEHPGPPPVVTVNQEEGSAMAIVGWTSVAVGIAAVGLYVGRELRARYKFNHRTQYDFFSHAGDSVCAADYGTGI
jgi:acetyl-CoA acetyltransferase